MANPQGFALLSLTMLLAVGGCSRADSPEPGPAPEPTPSQTRTIVVTPRPIPDGVHLSFSQLGINTNTDLAAVRVANGSHTEPIRVRSVGIDWPGFPDRRLQARPYRIGPQQQVDLDYRLPRARCDRRVLDQTAYGVVRLNSGRQRLPLAPDGVRFLTRLWELACDQRAIRRAVEVEFLLGRAGGSAVPATIRLTRRIEDPPLRLTDVRGTVLFDLVLPAPVSLPPGRDRVDVPLTVDPNRCDEHARSQASQPFAFRAWLDLGRRSELPIGLPVSAAQRRELLDFLDRACGGITSH